MFRILRTESAPNAFELGETSITRSAGSRHSCGGRVVADCVCAIQLAHVSISIYAPWGAVQGRASAGHLHVDAAAAAFASSLTVSARASQLMFKCMHRGVLCRVGPVLATCTSTPLLRRSRRR